MRAADLVTATLLLCLAGLVVWDSLRLGAGWGPSGPRSGFFPFWLGSTMAVCCAAIVARSLFRPDPRPFVPPGARAPLLKFLLPAAGLVLLTQALGLYVAAAAYLALYMRWIGRHSWPLVAALAVGFPVVTFLVFELWFRVPMPKGPVEAWLGY
jgi:putative tricarboxylic transport membrane protein